MKNSFTLSLLLCCSLLYANPFSRSHQFNTGPFLGYKTHIGLYGNIGSVVVMEGDNIKNPFGLGIGVERVIYRRYVLIASYSSRVDRSMEFNHPPFVRTLRLDNRLYIKKTKDHVFVSLGYAWEWRQGSKQDFHYRTKQGNMTMGIGFSTNLNSLFKNIKTDRLMLEMFTNWGIRRTAAYPLLYETKTIQFSNDRVGIGMIGLKYSF